MEKSKNGFLNSLTLYQLPLLSKIAFLCSAIGLTLLISFGLVVLDEKMLAVLSDNDTDNDTPNPRCAKG